MAAARAMLAESPEDRIWRLANDEGLGLLLKRVDSKPPSSTPRASFSTWSAARDAPPTRANPAALALWLFAASATAEPAACQGEAPHSGTVPVAALSSAPRPTRPKYLALLPIRTNLEEPAPALKSSSSSSSLRTPPRASSIFLRAASLSAPESSFSMEPSYTPRARRSPSQAISSPSVRLTSTVLSGTMGTASAAEAAAT
mmetsp:Transcript_38751/g.109576  ORF Transcript_38751/g.109576 Transcript_38751/m.109576 type:complete len:201 (-) Transcript_38751:356-958(-)